MQRNANSSRKGFLLGMQKKKKIALMKDDLEAQPAAHGKQEPAKALLEFLESIVGGRQRGTEANIIVFRRLVAETRRGERFTET